MTIAEERILDSGLLTTVWDANHQPLGDVYYAVTPDGVSALAWQGTPAFTNLAGYPYMPDVKLWNVDGRVWRITDCRYLATTDFDGVTFARYLLTFEESR